MLFETALIIMAPCLMMPRLLVFLADHVAGDVLNEHQRHIVAVGKLNELRRLLRLVGKQHAAGDWPGCRSGSRKSMPSR